LITSLSWKRRVFELGRSERDSSGGRRWCMMIGGRDFLVPAYNFLNVDA
jgi:hypothetical protein